MRVIYNKQTARQTDRQTDRQTNKQRRKPDFCRLSRLHENLFNMTVFDKMKEKFSFKLTF